MNTKLNFYYPSIEKGGLEKNLFSLINSLARKNYKINFVTYKNITEYKLEEVAQAHIDIESRKTTGSVILKT